MATYGSYKLESGNLLTVTEHLVQGLDMKHYLEYRLEERDDAGAFLGYCAMGSRDFISLALARRIHTDLKERKSRWGVVTVREVIESLIRLVESDALIADAPLVTSDNEWGTYEDTYEVRTSMDSHYRNGKYEEYTVVVID